MQLSHLNDNFARSALSTPTSPGHLPQDISQTASGMEATVNKHVNHAIGTATNNILRMKQIEQQHSSVNFCAIF
jgi:hypothetical protein